MTTKIKVKITKLLLFITLIASIGALTGCNVGNNYSNMAEYYGCPNSRRVNKLQVKRIRKLKRFKG